MMCGNVYDAVLSKFGFQKSTDFYWYLDVVVDDVTAVVHRTIKLIQNLRGTFCLVCESQGHNAFANVYVIPTEASLREIIAAAKQFNIPAVQCDVGYEGTKR